MAASSMPATPRLSPPAFTEACWIARSRGASAGQAPLQADPAGKRRADHCRPDPTPDHRRPHCGCRHQRLFRPLDALAAPPRHPDRQLHHRHRADRSALYGSALPHRPRRHRHAQWSTIMSVTGPHPLPFGGRVSAGETDPRKRVAPLKAEMARFFPELLPGTRRSWMGFVAYPFDKLPHIGCKDGIHFAMGYCGSGIAHGELSRHADRPADSRQKRGEIRVRRDHLLSPLIILASLVLRRRSLFIAGWTAVDRAK